MIAKRCYNFSSLLLPLTPANNENLLLLTPAYLDEKSILSNRDKRLQPKEAAQEKIFAVARNFK